MQGIILMTLGSPDSTSVKDVRKYLNEFLMDEKVIDMAWLPRLLLVRGIIVPFRAPKTAHAYSTVWTKDGSPLVVLTKELQDALQKQIGAPVTIAMRYGNPSPEEAFNELMQKVPELSEVLLIPMYPHYAMSSYETAVEYAQEIHKKKKYPFALKVIKPFFDNAEYLDALTESIRPHLEKEYDHVLFSYHGLPERHILKGDITGNHCLKSANCCSVNSPAHSQCYRHQCLTTMRLVAEKLGLQKEKYSFSFQSRLGRDEWLKPDTAKRLEEMPNEGIRKLLIVCPAFTSDCLETLEEIAMQGKESFMGAGGESFVAIPCLNVHPLWIATLTKWIKEYSNGSEEMILA
jgi:ferrochelatase